MGSTFSLTNARTSPLTKTSLSSPSSSLSSASRHRNVAMAEAAAAAPVSSSSTRQFQYGGKPCSGKTFCRKSAIAFIRVFSVISAPPIFFTKFTPFVVGALLFASCSSSYSSSTEENVGTVLRPFWPKTRVGGFFRASLRKLFRPKRDTFYVTLFRGRGND